MKNFISTILGLLLLVSCQHSSKNHLKIAATSVPHAEILEIIQPALEREGIELDIYVIDDYHIGNRALADKEIDANFFQHLPFLEAQIHDFGYQIEPLVGVHLEPMGVYSQTLSSLKDLKKGAKIAVPSDPSNQARALALLEQNGLMTFKNKGVNTTVLDVDANPLQLQLVEMDAPLLSRSLEDVDAAVINANFALLAGLSPLHDALALEDNHSLYVNYVVIRKGDKDRPDLQKLKEALTSETVKTFIQNRYKGALLSVEDVPDKESSSSSAMSSK